jgi:dienelactone hydrolase
MTKKLLLTVLALSLYAGAARAEVKTKEVVYEHDGVKLKGYLAWDDAAKGKRPGVLVVHEWWGLNEYERKRAEQLAVLGYVAFACDMYGEGKTTQHPKEAKAMSGEVRGNMKTWLGRAAAGLKVLQDHEGVDGKKLAAIGYCFGGSTALQMAFNGQPLAAAVSFHGALPVPSEEQAKGVKARLLICHGALDTFIPEETAQKFRAALDEAKVDYQMVYYGGAVHSFTVPGADKAGVKGIAYNENADRRSFQHMQLLFNEVFVTAK